MADLIQRGRDLKERICHAEAEAWIGEALEELGELTAWQEKVCAIIQPAETPDEWGADVADIIAMREEQRRALVRERDELRRFLEQKRLAVEEATRPAAALQEEGEQAKAREETLNLAATQYSESRDAWFLEAKRLRQVCEHALHKIEQTLAGQYPDGQALQSAQSILSGALAAREVEHDHA